MEKRLEELTVEDKARAFDFLVDQLKKCDCPGVVIGYSDRHKDFGRFERVPIPIYEWTFRSNGEPDIMTALLANVGIKAHAGGCAVEGAPPRRFLGTFWSPDGMSHEVSERTPVPILLDAIENLRDQLDRARAR